MVFYTERTEQRMTFASFAPTSFGGNRGRGFGSGMSTLPNSGRQSTPLGALLGLGGVGCQFGLHMGLGDGLAGGALGCTVLFQPVNHQRLLSEELSLPSDVISIHPLACFFSHSSTSDNTEKLSA